MLNQTIDDMLQHASDLLPGSGTPRLDMELLICNALDCNRSALYANPDQFIPGERINRFLSLVEKRAIGIPVAYLLGIKEFWSLQFQVNQDTLIPRPETECLVETVLEHIPLSTVLQIADLGTGCGAIAVAIATERPACRITATDRYRQALCMAEYNARRMKIDTIHFLESDWYSSITDRFDIIVSNPPYIPAQDPHLLSGEIRHEPLTALNGGEDGLAHLSRVINPAQDYLKPGGSLFVEHGYDQANAVQGLFRHMPDYPGSPMARLGRNYTGSNHDV